VSVTPLAPERLTEELAWSCRIVIADETGDEKAVTSGRRRPACLTTTGRLVLIETVCGSQRMGTRGIVEA
jgi:hypothetical protein